MTEPSWPFVKGHGTENDFLILPDLHNELPLTAADVARLCDRRAGLGADGILRVVRTRHLAPAEPAFATATAEFFMDYRNADGSVAGMCGNGARVFARYLVDANLTGSGTFDIATRSGTRAVTVPANGNVTVDMGPARLDGHTLVDGQRATFVDMGNPHAVVFVVDTDALGDLQPDRLDVNVEYVQTLAADHLRMRVHERGVGETRSCGTGACAAVVAHSLQHRTARGTDHRVDVPGGRLQVTWHDKGHLTLSGPAVLVAQGHLTLPA